MLGLSIGLTLDISMLAVSADSGLDLIVLQTTAAMVISSATFGILYKFFPNVPVSFRSAFVGAVSAGFLFEIVKKVFGVYLSYFPTYQLIYGALATIPILFIWIYISWIIVLLGAEIAVTTECMRSDG
jgi:membrane protein